MTGRGVDYRFQPDVLLATVARGHTAGDYPRRHTFFSQGDVADAVFFIVRGGVKIAVTSEQGKEAVVALLGRGDVFGELCLMGQPLRLATATATMPTRAIRVDRGELSRALHADPALSEAFTAFLLKHNSRIEADLMDHLFNSSERRLARILLLLAEFDKDGRSRPVTPKVSQETLAEMVGTTRPRVNHFMNKFKKQGHIEYNAELTVHGSLLSVILPDDEALPAKLSNIEQSIADLAGRVIY